MRRWALSLRMGSALAACIAIGVAGSAGATTLSYTATLTFGIWNLPSASAKGTGVYVGPAHISTIGFGAGQFGPVNALLPVTSIATTQSVRISGLANLSGTMTGIALSPTFGGPMGFSGLVKICQIFATGCDAYLSVPLTPTIGGAGIGVGGTQIVTNGVAGSLFTMYHAPWTIGQPTMTIHTPNSTITTPELPGGFAASATCAAVNSGVLQLVTVTKVFGTRTADFPELPVFATLRLHFVPEPGTLLLLGSSVAGLAVLGRRRHRR